MLQYIVPAAGLLFTLENILWINIGVFIGSVFAAIPGLTVILCVILFLPFTYQMTAIPGMMFLLGIYCAGGYGGSVSAILINTPGTPHAAATMLDGHPLSKQGRTKAALKIALYASTFGGVFSALMLLFLGPQVAKVAAQLGTAEYFMVCLFGLTIIAGVSGKSMIKGIIAACIGLLISCIGSDPMTGYDRLTFGIGRLYLGLDLAVCLIGLFALVEIISKAELKPDALHLGAKKMEDAWPARCCSPPLSAPWWASSPVPGPPRRPGSAITPRKTCPSIRRSSATGPWRASPPPSPPTTPLPARP